MLGDGVRQGYKGLAILAHHGTTLMGYKCFRDLMGWLKLCQTCMAFGLFPLPSFVLFSFPSFAQTWIPDKYSAGRTPTVISICIWRMQPVEICARRGPKKQLVR